MSTDTMTEAYTWQGRELVGSDGGKIGSVKEIYEDASSGKPEWALVSTGLFGARSHFVPLAGATTEGETVRVNTTKNQVKDAPSVEGENELTEDDERRLFEHYGVPYTDEGSVTAQGTPAGGTAGTAGTAETTGTTGTTGTTETTEGAVGHDTSGPTTDDAMTRSEEELRVGKTSQERGRARLRKYVVTENVEQTVPVQHEEVRLEREPVTEANRGQALDGPAISEEEHEVVLHEEQPVVERNVVPKERVRLGTETVTEERQVSEQVRKEQIEPEGEQL